MTVTLRRAGNPHGAGKLRNGIEPQQAPRQPPSIRRTGQPAGPVAAPFEAAVAPPPAGAKAVWIHVWVCEVCGVGSGHDGVHSLHSKRRCEFLARLAETCGVEAAYKAVGMDRIAAYEWKREYAEFSAA